MKIKSKFILNIFLLFVFLILDISLAFVRFYFLQQIKSDETVVYETNKKVIIIDPESINDRNILNIFEDTVKEFTTNDFKRNYPEVKKINSLIDQIENDLKNRKNKTYLPYEKEFLDYERSLNEISKTLLDLSYSINMNAKSASDVINYLFFGSFVILIISIINFLNISRLSVSSINTLIKGINSIKEGILDDKILIRNNDEYRILSDNINAMSDKLQESYNVLQDEINIRVEKERKIISSERRYKSFFEKNNAIMLLIDTEKGRVIDANPAAARYYGYKKRELIDMNIYDINIIDNDLIMNKICENIQPEENHFFLKQKNAIGEIKYVEVFQTPIYVDDKRMSLSIVFDITEKIIVENNLENSLQNYRLLFNNVNDAIFVYELGENNQPTNFKNINDLACVTLGYLKEELLKKNIIDISLAGSKDNIMEGLQNILKEKKIKTETLFVNKSKKQIPVEINSNLITIDGKKTIIAIAHDISDRKKREELLIKSRDEYLKILNDFPNPIIKSNENRKFDYFNSAWFSFTGRSTGKDLGSGWEEVIHEDDMDGYSDIFNESFLRKKSFETEIRLKYNDGTYHWVSISSIPFFNMEGIFKGFIVSCYDINTIKISNARILESLKEKDLLIKEIHHRVKNNLQIIQSLLNLQMLKIDSKEIKEMMKINQDRIRSMALIYESIYQSSNFTKIDFENYLRYICMYLIQNYHINTDMVKVNIHVKEIFLKIDTSIPLGLIINELVSNSLKHSFADGRIGEIDLNIERISETSLELTLIDNGIEFPQEVDVNNTKSFGYVLVNNLVSQINGQIKIGKIDGKNKITIGFVES